MTASPQPKAEAARRIEAAQVVYVSAASTWEVATKARLGKVSADWSDRVAAIASSGFTELPVLAAHAARVAARDRHPSAPCDRLPVAQALTEPVHLLTADAALRRYREPVTVIRRPGSATLTRRRPARRAPAMAGKRKDTRRAGRGKVLR